MTRPWVTRGHPERLTLEQVPVLRMLLPEVEQSHRCLLHILGITATPERLSEIAEALDVLVSRHNEVLRGIWYKIRAEKGLTREPMLGIALERLRNALLPGGLGAMATVTGILEAHSRGIGSWFSRDDFALLCNIKTLSGRSLLDSVDEWLDLVAQIVRLARERERLGAFDEALPTQADVLSARKRWLCAVQAVCSVAALVADNPNVQAILTRVDAMARQVARRSGLSSPQAPPPFPVHDQIDLEDLEHTTTTLELDLDAETVDMPLPMAEAS